MMDRALAGMKSMPRKVLLPAGISIKVVANISFTQPP
jgi:hypothetical protein